MSDVEQGALPVQHVRVRSRASMYTHLLAVCLGTLLAGLGLPFVVGDRVVSVSSDGREFGALPGGPTPFGDAAVTPGTSGGESGGPTTGGRSPSGTPGTSTGGPSPTLPDGTAAPPDGGQGPPGPRTASDVGVTETAIRLGVLVPDLGSFTGVPGVGDSGFDERTYRAMYQAYADELNARGGIQGRTVELVYHTVALEEEEQANQRACVFFTQDQQVFAVLDSSGQIRVETLDCIFRGSGAPAIDQNGFASRDYFPGLFTIHPTKDRMIETLVATMHELGELGERRIGLVDNAADRALIDDIFLPVLESYGYEITYRATLSDNPGETASQLPVHATRMKNEGIEVVFLLSLAAASGLMVQAAESQNFHPRWLTSDFNGGTLDFTAGLFPPNTNAIGQTSERTGEWRAGAAEPAYDASCRERFNSRSTIGPVERGTTSSSNPYEHALKVCTHFDLFEAAANLAGPTLTRAGFLGAMESFAEVSIGFSAPGSITEQKHDARDFARIVEFRTNCPGDGRNCYYPVTDFVRGS